MQHVAVLDDVILPFDTEHARCAAAGIALMIADPYPRLFVSRDQVNQGAAIVLTTVGVARELGIPASRFVYLRGYAKVADRPLLDRSDLGAYPAAELAGRAALRAAGIGVGDVACFDLYICFPVAVSSVCDALAIAEDDPRGLTVTGGLPYFGGPGNDYALHAVASMVERARPGSFGFVGANGGMLSKYSAGVYASSAAPFVRCDSGPLQAELDARPAVPFTEQPRAGDRRELHRRLREGGAARDRRRRRPTRGRRAVHGDDEERRRRDGGAPLRPRRPARGDRRDEPGRRGAEPVRVRVVSR